MPRSYPDSHWDGDEELRPLDERHDEDTPLLSVGSLSGYSYGYQMCEPIIPEEKVSAHRHVRMVDTTAMTRTRMDDQEGAPSCSLHRSDSFLSVATALTEVSQYDLDTGTRIASLERKGHSQAAAGMNMAVGAIEGISRFSPAPFHFHNRRPHGTRNGGTFLKKSNSTPQMALYFEASSSAVAPPKSSLMNHRKHPPTAGVLRSTNDLSAHDPLHPMTLGDATKEIGKKPFWSNNKLIVATGVVVLVAAVTTVIILVWKEQQHETTSINDNDDTVDTITQQRKLVFTVSLSATVKLLSAVGLGALAASKKPSPKASHMILDQVAVSSLSRLVFWVFQPCFFLCRVANTIAATTKHGSADGISRSSLALMPVVALMQICISSLVAKLVLFFSHRTNDGMSDEERTMVENSKRDAQVCMTFANSGPLPLLFANALFVGGQGGVEEDVTACISFYLLGWSPTFWSYGRYLVGTYGGDSDSLDDSLSKNSFERLCDGIKDFGKQVKKVFAPPIIGSTLGIVIGSIPFLRDGMLETDGILYPLFGAMDTLGSAYLPSVILVLAGSLVGGSKKGNPTGSTKRPTNASLDITTLVSILLSRFALAPVASIAVVYVLTRVNLLPPVGTRTHAIVSFVMLMEGCMPPAQNSILMLQLEGLTARAGNMARTVTLIYVLSVLPVTIWLMCMMGMSGVMAFR